MAKVDVKGIKGRKQIVHAVYDFSKDGGTFDTGNEIDLFKFAAGTIVHDMWLETETLVESAGAATMEVGITGGDIDGFMVQLGKATLIADFVSDDSHKGALLEDGTDLQGIKYKAVAETIASLLIGTADLTAGKVHFYAECSDGY